PSRANSSRPAWRRSCARGNSTFSALRVVQLGLGVVAHMGGSMILIWKGLGGVVAIIWFCSLLIGDPLAKMLFGPNASRGLHNITGEWLAAILTLSFAVILRI